MAGTIALRAFSCNQIRTSPISARAVLAPADAAPARREGRPRCAASHEPLPSPRPAARQAAGEPGGAVAKPPAPTSGAADERRSRLVLYRPQRAWSETADTLRQAWCRAGAARRRKLARRPLRRRWVGDSVRWTSRSLAAPHSLTPAQQRPARQAERAQRAPSCDALPPRGTQAYARRGGSPDPASRDTCIRPPGDYHAMCSTFRVVVPLCGSPARLLLGRVERGFRAR